MAVQAYSPNMRFAASFLDLYKKDELHAVKDEVMMDKRTGQLVYKRNSDGKLIYYAQENVHQNNFVRQLKVLMTNNKKKYIHPTSANCEYYDDVYFISYNIEMIDWKFDDVHGNKFIEGGILQNNAAVPHSFVQETNGFFVQLNGRPRDRAVTSFLCTMYDNYYSKYKGTDPDAIAKKDMYTISGYGPSQATINYTVTYYDGVGTVVASNTYDGYIRINELSFVGFPMEAIYPRTRVSRAEITINSISTPKLQGAIALTKSDAQAAMLAAITDNDDIAFISCNISTFVCTEDNGFTMPTLENTIPIMAMGSEEFDREIANAKEGGGGISGIHVSVEEPDTQTWEDITIWAEIIRYTSSDGTSEETKHRTDLSSMEKGLESFTYITGKLTTNPNEPNAWYIEEIDPFATTPTPPTPSEPETGEESGGTTPEPETPPVEPSPDEPGGIVEPPTTPSESEEPPLDETV